MSSVFPLYFSGMVSDTSSIGLMNEITRAFNNSLQTISNGAMENAQLQDINEIQAIISDESSSISDSLNNATTIIKDLQDEKDQIESAIAYNLKVPGLEDYVSSLKQDLTVIDDEINNILTKVVNEIGDGLNIDSDIKANTPSLDKANEDIDRADPNVVESATIALNAEDEAFQSAKIAQNAQSLEVAQKAVVDAMRASLISTSAAQNAFLVTINDVLEQKVPVRGQAGTAWVASSVFDSRLQASQALYEAAAAATRLAEKQVSDLSSAGTDERSMIIANAQLQTAYASEKMVKADLYASQVSSEAQLQAALSMANAATVIAALEGGDGDLATGAGPAPSTPISSTPYPPPTYVPTPSTPAPSTPAPSTPAPSTPAPSTPAPSTPAPSTPAPSPPAPSTPATTRDQLILWRDQAQGNLTQAELIAWDIWSPLSQFRQFNVPFTELQVRLCEAIDTAKTILAQRRAQYVTNTRVQMNWVPVNTAGNQWPELQTLTVLNSDPTTTYYVRIILPPNTTNVRFVLAPYRTYITNLPDIQVPPGIVSMLLSFTVEAHGPVPNGEQTTIYATINNGWTAEHFIRLKINDGF